MVFIAYVRVDYMSLMFMMTSLSHVTVVVDKRTVVAGRTSFADDIVDQDIGEPFILTSDGQRGTHDFRRAL